MDNRLPKTFKAIQELEPPIGLDGLIIQKIDTEKKRILKRKIIFSRIGIAGSFIAILAILPILGGYILKSDFWSMVSLAFSDLTIVARNWKEFGFSLMENFPALPLAIILTPIFTLLLSAGSYFNSTNNNQHKYI